MRTVPGATVSGVTSLRLLRQYLWRHTGSSLPFQIRAAALWPSIFRACSIAPRGGPPGEPSWPSGFRPTTSSLYLRGRWFHFIFFPAFAPPEHFEPLPLRSSRRRSTPRSFSPSRLCEEAPLRFAPQRFTEARPPLPFRAPPRLLPPLLHLCSSSPHLRRPSSSHPPPQVSLNAPTFSPLLPSSSWADRVFIFPFLLFFLLLVDLCARLDPGKLVFR